MKKPGTRPLIAYFSAYIDPQISKSRFLGITDQARVSGTNLICFVTHFLGDTEGFEKQANILFDFVTPQTFDGLIIANIYKDDTKRFSDMIGSHRFDLPAITVRENLDGVPFLPNDNYESMREMIRHLIQVHARRKIVFIRGPAQHVNAQGRYQGYLDALAEAGIPFREELVPPPIDWWKNNFLQLLDKQKLVPGKDFDAVACAGDLHALDVIKILQQRGIKLPQDVAVTGFNNYIDGTVISPSLTSVELNFYDKGKLVFEMMHSILNKRPPRKVFPITSKIILRESCGCLDPDIIDVTESPASQAQIPAVDRLQRAARIFQKRCAEMGLAERMPDSLAAEFFREVDNTQSEKKSPFLSLFRQQLRMAAVNREKLDLWYVALNGLCRELLALLESPESEKRADTLFQEMRLQYSQTMLILERTRALEEAKTSNAIRKFGQALLMTWDIDEMMDQVAAWLPVFSLPSCYVALYADPAKPVECTRLLLSVCDGVRHELEEGGLYFSTIEIVPAHLLPRERPYTLVVEALYTREAQIGYIVFEHTQRDPSVFALFAGQLVNALQIALTVYDLEETRTHLDRKAQELSRSNRELEQFAYAASHDLQEPLRKITTMADRIKQLSSKNMAPQIADYLERMTNATARMHTLITDLLEYSRVTRKPRPFEPVDLGNICAQVTGDLEASIQKTQGRVETGSLPVVEAEPVLMRQLFQNLIANALKFKRPDVAPVVTIGAGVHDSQCTLSVSDNGIGIPSEFHTRIFGIFERLHSRSQYEGSGIGLSICKKIVEYHHGTIRVESAPGQGTTFIITLPLHRIK